MTDKKRFLPKSVLPSEPERRVLSLVHRYGTIPRSDLDKRSSYSQASVYRIVDSLVGKGLLKLLQGEVRGRGKPSPRVCLNTDELASAGLSYTTDTVRLALLDLTGATLEDSILDADPNLPKDVLDALDNRLDAFFSDNPHRPMIGLGVAMQGWRSGQIDRFRTPPGLSEWDQVPLIDVLSERLSGEIIAENNATSAAIAEQLVGRGRETDCLAYLSFNAGFGGGFVWSRKAVFGGHGNAGELSSMFEQEDAHHRPALSELILRLKDNGIVVRDLNDLAERFDADWPGVQAWIAEITPQLKQAVRAIKATIDPNVIFFGGEAPEDLRALLIKAADISRAVRTGPDPELRRSGIKGDSAHIGAALLPIHQLLLDGRD